MPVVNACLNALATVLLVLGYGAIKAGRVRLHKTAMLTALAVSATFLASYLYYHFVVRGAKATTYTGEWRPAYLLILLTHTVLAATAAPLALTTAILGLRGRLSSHKKIARWTLPIWLYVSVTGVVIYMFLKDLYPNP